MSTCDGARKRLLYRHCPDEEYAHNRMLQEDHLSVCKEYQLFLRVCRASREGANAQTPGLNTTASTAVHLCRQRPIHLHKFNCYMDNIPLFECLRNLGIDACGTVRSSYKKKLPLQHELQWQESICRLNALKTKQVGRVLLIFFG
jgi:hypothetical protein